MAKKKRSAAESKASNGRIIGTIMGPPEWVDKKAVTLFEHLIHRYEATSTIEGR